MIAATGPVSPAPWAEGRIVLLAGDELDGVLELVVLVLSEGHRPTSPRRRFLAAAADLAGEAGFAEQLVAALQLVGTSCVTVMSGWMPEAWMERLLGV